MKRRLLVGAVILAVWSAAIEARLVYLQVIRHGDLSAKAESADRYRGNRSQPRRHPRSQRPRPAYSVEAESIYAVPSEIGNVDKIAAALCGALDDCSARDRDAISAASGAAARSRTWSVRSRRTRRGVAALRLDGVGLMKESRRYYRTRTWLLTCRVRRIDNKGLSGIEAA